MYAGMTPPIFPGNMIQPDFTRLAELLQQFREAKDEHVRRHLEEVIAHEMLLQGTPRRGRFSFRDFWRATIHALARKSRRVDVDGWPSPAISG